MDFREWSETYIKPIFEDMGEKAFDETLHDAALYIEESVDCFFNRQFIYHKQSTIAWWNKIPKSLLRVSVCAEVMLDLMLDAAFGFSRISPLFLKLNNESNKFLLLYENALNSTNYTFDEIRGELRDAYTACYSLVQMIVLFEYCRSFIDEVSDEFANSSTEAVFVHRKGMRIQNLSDVQLPKKLLPFRHGITYRSYSTFTPTNSNNQWSYASLTSRHSIVVRNLGSSCSSYTEAVYFAVESKLMEMCEVFKIPEYIETEENGFLHVEFIDAKSSTKLKQLIRDDFWLVCKYFACVAFFEDNQMPIEADLARELKRAVCNRRYTNYMPEGDEYAFHSEESNKKRLNANGFVDSVDEILKKHNRGGRPSIYEPLVDEYRKGLNKKWNNTGEYYDHLKENDASGIRDIDGGVIKRKTFADGLQRYDRDHPEEPSDKTPE